MVKLATIRGLWKSDPDAIVRHVPHCLWPALVIGYLCAAHDLPGLISAFQLGSLALSAISLAGYRTERGLWMLALLFGVMWTSVYFGCLYGEFRDWQRGAVNAAGLGVEAAIGSMLLKTHSRFLWKAARYNRRLPR